MACCCCASGLSIFISYGDPLPSPFLPNATVEAILKKREASRAQEAAAQPSPQAPLAAAPKTPLESSKKNVEIKPEPIEQKPNELRRSECSLIVF